MVTAAWMRYSTTRIWVSCAGLVPVMRLAERVIHADLVARAAARMSVPPSSLLAMNMNDPNAVAVEFRAMMRAILRDEKVGEDTLGKLVELTRRRSTDDITDAELRVALRGLHAEAVDPSEPQDVADEFISMQRESYGATRASTEDAARGRAMAKFVANSRRLKNGEITRAEFEEIMRDEPGGIRWL